MGLALAARSLGGGTPAWWACCPFGFVADSAPDGCCERLYNGVFWWGPGRGERRGGGRGGEGGNRAKDKPGSSGTASPGPREPAGERLWGSGAELAAMAPLAETELSIPLPAPILSPVQKSPPFLETFLFYYFFPRVSSPGSDKGVVLPRPRAAPSSAEPPAAFIPTALLLSHLPTSTKARDCTRKLMFISLKGMFGVTFDLCRSLPLLPSLQLQRKHSNDPLFLFWNFILMLWRFAK